MLTRRRFTRIATTASGAITILATCMARAEPKRGDTLNFVLEQEPTTLVAAPTTDNVTKVSAKDVGFADL